MYDSKIYKFCEKPIEEIMLGRSSEASSLHLDAYPLRACSREATR